jgi:hypothetical protein
VFTQKSVCEDDTVAELHDVIEEILEMDVKETNTIIMGD